MSTNQTEHLNLHRWEPQDAFSREEFNENFAAIDGALAAADHIVTGTYDGNDAATRDITLGFQPKALLLMDTGAGNYRVLLALPGMNYVSEKDGSMVMLTLTATGFRVANGTYYQGGSDRNHAPATNKAGYTYRYLAVK